MRADSIQVLRRVVDVNRRLSARLEGGRDAALYRRYDSDVAAEAMMLPAGAIVVDIGGGRHCSFADKLPSNRTFHLVAVDISLEELAHNHSVDETRVGDVTNHLPFADGEVDLIVSRTLLEHVTSIRRAAGEIARVLGNDGRSIHLLPCRYALFALAARVMPFSTAKRVLHALLPESRGVIEFDVIYDRCYPTALKRVFKDVGFRQVQVECTWDQSEYFQSLFPIFLLVVAYQRLAEFLGVTRLASYAIVRAAR